MMTGIGSINSILDSNIRPIIVSSETGMCSERASSLVL